MRLRWCIALAIAASPAAPAQAFLAGVYATGPDSTCIAGPGDFDQFAWAWTRGGMVYATLRLEFPANLDVRAEPVFDPRVIQFIRTGYADGSEEWHMVLAGCPAGWVRLFRQAVTLLDDQPSQVVIRGGDSWIRDCSFVLHRPEVTGSLRLNGVGCESVEGGRRSWSTLKAGFDRPPR